MTPAITLEFTVSFLRGPTLRPQLSALVNLLAPNRSIMMTHLIEVTVEDLSNMWREWITQYIMVCYGQVMCSVCDYI